jgi:NAD(P)-dependent dehydrogenase (short-subunit alcohol dehydrogenase family)
MTEKNKKRRSVMDTKRFEGKIILITGGNSGIGFAAAKRIAGEGGQVIITGRDGEKLKKAVQELGGKAQGIVADVSKISDLEKLYAEIQKKFGRLDGLFANAGISIMGPIDQVTEAAVDSLMDINIKGTFFTLQKALPLFSKGAAVVLTASVTDTKGPAPMAVYAATKAAVRSMARTFSSHLLPRAVRVNVVSPGPIETPIWDSVNDAGKATRAELVPSKRFGTAEEVASAAAFLLSDESSYILGAELYIDGGVSQL